MMIQTRHTDSDRTKPEIGTLPHDFASLPLRAGRRIPVRWWDSATSAVPVYDGKPRVQFRSGSLFAENESAPLVAAG
jgi:hypothetical protein